MEIENKKCKKYTKTGTKNYKKQKKCNIHFTKERKYCIV